LSVGLITPHLIVIFTLQGLWYIGTLLVRTLTMDHDARQFHNLKPRS